MIGNFFTFYSTIGIIMGMLLSYLANSQIVEWQLIIMCLMGVEMIAIIINVLLHKVDVSYYQQIEKGDLAGAAKILDRYCLQETRDEMIREEKEFIDLRKQKKGQNLIRIYWKEFMVCMGISALVISCLASIYSSNIILLTCKDITDLEEAQVATFYSTLASLIEIVPKLTQLLYPQLTRKRKFNFALGQILIGSL